MNTYLDLVPFFGVRKMKARILLLAGIIALLVSMSTGYAAALDITADTNPYHNERTMTSTELDVYYFSVASSENTEWSVVVKSGLNCDIFLTKTDQVDSAKAGDRFISLQSTKDTKTASGTANSKGDWAILVTTTGTTSGNATYTIDITRRAQTAGEVASNTLFYMLIIVVIILVVVGWIVRALRVARAFRMRSEQPPQQVPGAMVPGQMPPGAPPQAGYQPPPSGYQPPPTISESQLAPEYRLPPRPPQ